MKPLKKVGKDDPKGWEQPQDGAFPIIPEPEDDNELPVPYYDSDDIETDDDDGSYDTDYTSDSSAVSCVRLIKSTSRTGAYPTIDVRVYHTFVQEEMDFLQE
jgi:hypothetical protein